MPIVTVEEGLAEIREGRMVILVNEEAADTDGFFCIPAENITAESVNHMLHHGRGVIYLALTEERIRELGIPLTPQDGSGLSVHQYGAAFSVRLEGVHGVSAKGRAYTMRAAVADETTHNDLIIPGHVQPIQARGGGVLARSGRAEASADLARLAGLKPAGVICHILEEEGSVALLPSLERVAEEQRLKIVSVASLIAYRLRTESLVKRVAEEVFPTLHGGVYKAIVYRNEVDNTEHMALLKGEIRDGDSVLVRMHSECLTGDVFGSERCDCELGFKEDLRDYGIGAQMLRELGVNQVRLLTNNPRKITGLQNYGLKVVERVPLEVPPRDTNIHYLRTKQSKLGHLLSNLEAKPVRH